MIALKVPYRRTFGAAAFGEVGTASAPVVSVFFTINVTSPMEFVVPFKSAPDAESDPGTVIFVLHDSQFAFDPLYGEFICSVTSLFASGLVPSEVTRYLRVKVVPAAMYV